MGGGLDVLRMIDVASGALALALAGFLVRRGIRTAGTWILAALLALYGLDVLLLLTPELFDARLPGGLVHLRNVIAISAFSLNLAFAAAYPAWTLSRRKAALLVASWVPGVAVLAATAVLPGVFIAPDGWRTPLLTDVLHVLSASSYLVVAWVFGRAWLAAAPGAYRRQFLFVLVPFLFWIVHDGLAGLSPLVLEAPFGRSPLVGARLALSGVQVTSAIILATLALRRAAGSDGPEGRDDRIIAGWVLATLPLSLVQFIVQPLPLGHALVDALFLFLLFYGVAKYRVLDIDLKVKVTVRRGTVAAAFLALTFVAIQLTQNFLGTYLGWAAGGALAGVATFAITPIQTMAGRLAEKVAPGAAPTEAYFTYRRFELYRVALEGMLRDGVVDAREASGLKGLRAKLGITMADHEALERELRTELGGASPAPAAA